MKRQPSRIADILRSQFIRKAGARDKYGQWYVDKAYVAAEVELCIGIVTATLILIYQQNLWLAIGTLVGFIILEFIILMFVSVAENVITIRQQLETLMRKRGEPVPSPEMAEGDPYKLIRIGIISGFVTLAIVLVRTYS